MRTRAIALGWIAAGFAASAALRADTVRLRNGARFEGRVVEAGDRLIIETPEGGRIEVARAQVARLDRGPSPQDLYAERLQELRPGDVEGRCELGRWCRQVGLYREGAEAFRSAVALAPDHAGAREALGYRRVGRAWIRGAWERVEGEGFVVHHVVPVEAARAALADLDAFRAAFRRAFAPPLRFRDESRIPVVLFDRRDDYFEHVQEAHPKLAGRPGAFERFPRAFAETPAPRIVGYLEPGEAPESIRTVLWHEATHALMATARAPGAKPPPWFEEALADYLACSSASGGEVRFVLGVPEHPLFRSRMARTRALVAAGTALPLREVIEREAFPFDDPRVEALYAQSFSLLHYLLARASADRPDGFRAYLAAAAEGRRGVEPVERHFGAAIGDLEARWKAFVAEGEGRQ